MASADDQLRRLIESGRGAALFRGARGTGKTLAAEVVARALGLDLYRVDLSALVSKFIGETEKNLDRIFAAAEKTGGVLYFDEADALFGRRTDVKDSRDRHANAATDYLLAKIEAYDGIVILATNRRRNIDPAFLRRIGTMIAFPRPE